jgi:hypothetical protein
MKINKSEAGDLQKCTSRKHKRFETHNYVIIKGLMK